MSGDILKSINKIKISVNENDQLLWECQAAAKSYKESTDKIKEECDRLNKEIKKTDEEINHTEFQIKMLESGCDVQMENISLNQQSLVNQQLYKNTLKEKIQNHQIQSEKILDEYSQHVQLCRSKLELSNPMYKTLQEKRTELKKCKIHCKILQKTISTFKEIRRRKLEIKRKLFYRDVIKFAQSWVNNRKYLNIKSCLEEATKTEKEYMQKLTEVTELLKQKQQGKVLQNQNSKFSVPQIDFPVASSSKIATEKEKIQPSNMFNHIKSMLEKKDAEMMDRSKKVCRNIEFNADSSKVRILDNQILNSVQSIEAKQVFKTKEERNKDIEAKIQKVVQAFNKKSISRQNSKRSVVLSQKSQGSKDVIKGKLSQQSNPDQECKGNAMHQNLQKDNPGVAQNLNVKENESHFLNPVSKNYSSQFSSKQQFYSNKENCIANDSGRYPKENNENKKYLQDVNIPPQLLSCGPKKVNCTGNVPVLPNIQSCGNLDVKRQRIVAEEKSPFVMSGFSAAFPSGIGNTNNAVFLGSSEENNQADKCNNTSLDVPGLSLKQNFAMDMSGIRNTNNAAFLGSSENNNQMDNFTMDMSDDYVYQSPEFTSAFSSQNENDGNMVMNYSGVPNFTQQSLFSFGQSNNAFSFK